MTREERGEIVNTISDVCTDTITVTEQDRTRQRFTKDCIKETLIRWGDADLKLWFILNVNDGQAYLDNKGLL